MLKRLISFLILIALVQPASALDPVITINVPYAPDPGPTNGFYIYPADTTFEPGTNLSFFNNDRNRRWFTVIGDREVFDNGTSNEAYLSFRQRASFYLNEPGEYNFHLKEFPTVKIKLTVTGDMPQPQETRYEEPVPDDQNPWGDLSKIPGFTITAAVSLMIIAVQIIKKRD